MERLTFKAVLKKVCGCYNVYADLGEGMCKFYIDKSMGGVCDISRRLFRRLKFTRKVHEVGVEFELGLEAHPDGDVHFQNCLDKYRIGYVEWYYDGQCMSILKTVNVPDDIFEQRWNVYINGRKF
jgi:hypothetical protein